MDLSQLNARQLLALHARVADELRGRGVTRSSNNPTGDFAEYIFCKAFGWIQSGKSNAHIDAIGPDGLHYQIKGRRMTRYNNSRQLGAIRSLEGGHFHFLAGVLFSEDYNVARAAIIPHAVVVEQAVFVKLTNSHRFLLRDAVWEASGVKDVTAQLQAVDF